MRVDLADGHWVELREDVDRIPNGDRKRVMRRFAAMQEGWDRNVEFNEGLACLLVTAWSLDLPTPGEKPEVLDEISAYDYDRILHAINGMNVKLYLSFDPEPDPDSPQVPSGV